MTALEVFLLMLDASGGKTAGKTLIQKRAYFLNQFLGLGLRFKPHYYGPYSPELDDAIGRAKVLGFVQERAIGFGPDVHTGFEVRRFDYELTPDGSRAAAALKERYPEEWERIAESLARIRQADNGNYVAISLAAKVFYILSASDTPLEESEIVAQAKNVGWQISERDVDRAARVLIALGLVRSQGQEASCGKF